jgi:hypothetical protein
VSDLTTEAFIAALKCITARTGLKDYLYTNNGSNFVETNIKLKAFFKSEKFRSHVHDYWGEGRGRQRENSDFIPPNSAHFGGLWEANNRQ